MFWEYVELQGDCIVVFIGFVVVLVFVFVAVVVAVFLFVVVAVGADYFL